jgi:hypothetical protein
VVADVNADGLPDLIPGGVSVVLGNGDGTFQAARIYGAGSRLPALGVRLHSAKTDDSKDEIQVAEFVP